MVADIANSRLPRFRYAPPHHLEKFADTPPPVEEAESPSARLGPLCPHVVDTPDPPLGPCAPVNAPTYVVAALASPGLSCPHVVNTPDPPLGPCAPVNAPTTYVVAALAPPGPSCPHLRRSGVGVSRSVVSTRCRHPRPTLGPVCPGQRPYYLRRSGVGASRRSVVSTPTS
jgi:hypothetical protein